MEGVAKGFCILSRRKVASCWSEFLVWGVGLSSNLETRPVVDLVLSWAKMWGSSASGMPWWIAIQVRLTRLMVAKMAPTRPSSPKTMSSDVH